MASRRCRAGLHEIPSTRVRCQACRAQRNRERRAVPENYPERACKSGRHTIPAGKHRCLECKREGDRLSSPAGRRGAVAALLRAESLPLGEILDGAACRIENAALFDVGAPKGERAEEQARHAQARAICAWCPVREDCYADAYAHRALGVYGGRVLDHAFWTGEGKRRAALVRSVQVVPDSSAC